MTELLVRKDQLREFRFAAEDADLAEGQAVLRISRFALTANNVTYAAIGDVFGYWKFFPAADGWGRVPVWGYADVEASKSPDLKAGERIWGYYPIASRLVVTPANASASGFVDGAAHRQGLPPIYNRYERVAADPSYDAARENQAALFRPLFGTGFLLDDFLDEHAAFGAKRVALASASSKTAMSLAKLLKDRGAVEVVGLTGAANTAFVERTGYYDRVVAYDRMDQLPDDADVTLVDMAGSTPVIDALADRLGPRFVYNCMVGAAHWDSARDHEPKGPPRTLFFAPDRSQKRIADWGPQGFAERYGAAWSGFVGTADRWLKPIEERGEDAVRTRWLALLDGKVRPDEGYILSL